MIGRVAAGPLVVELLGVDDWAVWVAGQRMPGMEKSLRVLYEDEYAGPADGHYGQLILKDLAKRLGGVADIEPRPIAAFNEIP
jgi:hypothetical protein